MATLKAPTGKDWPEGMSPRYKLFRQVVLFLGRILLGLRLHGEDRTPRQGPLVLAANHTRYLDPVFVCMAAPRRVQWMAKKEIFIPGLRRFFSLLGAFPVDREAGGRSALRNAMKLLSEGWALGIFPEGTHKKTEKTRDAKSGVSLLAVRGGARITPIHLGKVPTPLGRFRGERLHIHVGDPLIIHDTVKGRRAYKALAEEVLTTIYSLPGKGLENEERAER
ncbi:MAG: lysophospholipid acyltransferase family protein [Rubrobacteraceae bacterium]